MGTRSIIRIFIVIIAFIPSGIGMLVAAGNLLLEQNVSIGILLLGFLFEIFGVIMIVSAGFMIGLEIGTSKSLPTDSWIFWGLSGLSLILIILGTQIAIQSKVISTDWISLVIMGIGILLGLGVCFGISSTVPESSLSV